VAAPLAPPVQSLTMEQIAAAAAPTSTCLAKPTVRTHLRKPPKPVLRSRITGRDRWHVEHLEGRPRLAAAVGLALRTEPGITDARANALTGRVLVCYDPAALLEPIETLLERAVAVGPLSAEEFALVRSDRSGSWVVPSLVAAELMCCLAPMIPMIAGGISSLARAIALAFVLFKSATRAQRCCGPHAGPRLVLNQAG
jgi:hypothetical protein